MAAIQGLFWAEPVVDVQTPSTKALILETSVAQTEAAVSLAEPPPLSLSKGPAIERPRTREEKESYAEQVTNRVLDELGEALAQGRSDTLTKYLTTMAKFHSYSFGNLMLITWQDPDASHVAGFHKWKEFGRSVKKGEQGIMILAPVTQKVGEREVTHDDGTKETSDVRRIVNVKPVYVFDIRQTEGKELPEFAAVTGDPAESTERLKAFIRSKGITLDEGASLGRAQGVSEGGRIGIAAGLSPAEEFRTLTHETAHELLHKGERRKDTTKRSRELEAEAVAFVVCTAIGLDAKQCSTDYIHLYRGDREMLRESMEHIRRTANEILAALDV